MATSDQPTASLQEALAYSVSFAADAEVEVTAAELKLAKLTKEAIVWIGRGKAANLKLGQIFNQIKDEELEHGEWERYFKQHFLKKGISLRTAQTYMDEAKKNADSAYLPPAKSTKPRGKSGKAKASAPASMNSIPVDLDESEQDALDKLRASQNWYAARMTIKATLRNLFVQYGVWTELPQPVPFKGPLGRPDRDEVVDAGPMEDDE